jgi:predicted RNA-binding Zn-ribbon protein involved in translation (DUF1610 family)
MSDPKDYPSMTDAEFKKAIMSDTIECPTCGGSEQARFQRGRYIKVIAPCPDCANGRQPTPEVLERMAAAIFELKTKDMPVDPFGTHESDEQYRRQALAAWIAEHTEEQT